MTVVFLWRLYHQHTHTHTETHKERTFSLGQCIVKGKQTLNRVSCLLSLLNLNHLILRSCDCLSAVFDSWLQHRTHNVLLHC